jgi:uncharacterized repeat protein (TIGR03803 family)
MRKVRFYERATFTTVAVLLLVSGVRAATEQVLFSFGATRHDGRTPRGGLVFDSAENLYGTTESGGRFGVGSVFQLTSGAGGAWTETVIHSFTSKDGRVPNGNLVFDNAGNLYGTTQAGGRFDRGVVFELTPSAGGGWTEKVLHSFTGGYEGAAPATGRIIDASGNLYCTTTQAGR